MGVEAELILRGLLGWSKMSDLSMERGFNIYAQPGSATQTRVVLLAAHLSSRSQEQPIDRGSAGGHCE
jgi:hypothetical protein